jgi:uncharacterized protein YqeY
MSLSERIQKDLLAAMKAKQADRVSVLRLVKSALKNKEIELKSELSPEAEVQLLQTLVKQRNESIETFDKAGRNDLAEKERAELEVLRTYLPEEVTSEEIERVVNEVATELGASSPKDLGSVMKESLTRLKKTGKAVDGKAVNLAVRAKLSS